MKLNHSVQVQWMAFHLFKFTLGFFRSILKFSSHKFCTFLINLIYILSFSLLFRGAFLYHYILELVIIICVYVQSLQSCLFWDPMDCSWPDSFVHGVSWARILEWVTFFFFSRRSSQPKDRTCVSCLAGGCFTTEPHGKPRKTMGPLLLSLFMEP